MQARGYCGDLFPSVLCAVLCSWSWFLFVSIAGSLAGWEDLRGAGRQRVITQSSLWLCSFFSPQTSTSSFDHSFQIQATNIRYLHKLVEEGGKHTHTQTGIVCCGRNFVLFSPWCSAQFCSERTGTDSLPRWAHVQGISCICDYAERDVRKRVSSK